MTFSPEQLNFFKLSKIVLDEFPVALRGVFRFMWDTQAASPPGVPNWDDSVTCLNMFIAKEGGVKKVPNLNKSYKEWDCTALFKATLFAQTFAIPDGTGGFSTLGKLYVRPRGLSAGAFHPSVISPTGNQAETYALALDQLRLLRNTLCHQKNTQNIDKATFDNYIMLAKDAFTALGQDTTRIDEIGMMGEEDFPTAKQQQLEEELMKEKDAAIKFKQLDDHLKKIESQVEDVGSDVRDMKTRVGDVGSDVRELKADMDDIKQAMQAVSSNDRNMAQVVELVNGVVKLVDQAGNLWVALNDFFQCGAGRHNLIVGKAQPGDILLHQEQRRPSSKMFRYATHVFKYTGTKVITCVIAYDNWDDDTGGDPEIISGGPGHKHVEVQVKSQFCRGFNFTIYVYGKE